jgi:Lrp/AsnC family transcriptional regulator, leucine-responsive regulatory protein
MALNLEKHLDAVDWQILCALQENARVSFSELGRQVGLSSPAIAERVRRLEDAGVITGYRAQLDMEKVGFPITAFIRISATGASCAEIGNFAKAIPEVLECHRVTGTDSAIMKVVVSSVAHLQSLIDRLMHYGTPTTSIVLSSPVTNRIIEQDAVQLPSAG